MRTYELAVVLHPDLEVDLKGAAERLDKLIAKVGGKVQSVDDWGKQKLAYPIDKQTFGIYRFYNFDIEPSELAELDQSLILNEEVLRHLVVTEPKRPAPAKLTKSKTTKAKKVKLSGEDK